MESLWWHQIKWICRPSFFSARQRWKNLHAHLKTAAHSFTWTEAWKRWDTPAGSRPAHGWASVCRFPLTGLSSDEDVWGPSGECVAPCSARIGFAGWTVHSCEGCFDGSSVTRCPEPAADYISHTCGEALRGSHAAGIFIIPGVPWHAGQSKPWSCDVPPTLQVFPPSLWLPQQEFENDSKITTSNCSADNLCLCCHILD